MKPFIIDHAAEQELWRTAAWYESRQVGLGGAFISGFEAAVARIQQNPTGYAPEDESGARMAMLSRFPFAVVYLDEPTQVWVVAVADLRRRPRYWARRLPKA